MKVLFFLFKMLELVSARARIDRDLVRVIEMKI